MGRLIGKVCCVFLVAAFVGGIVHANSSGEPPVAVTPDGGRYWGSLVAGKLHGQGRLEWSNGEKYEGAFLNGLFSGQGRLKFADGDIYEGNFDDGMQSGSGRLTTSTGDTYTGEFRNGSFEGAGRWEGESGDIYEGQFKANLFSGHGKYVTTTVEYLGEFQNGQFWGNGEIKFKDGRKYVGGFLRGQFDGKGRIEYADGTVYEGDFVADEFTGQGVVTWADGRRHEGHFRKWRPVGPGIYSDGRGNTYHAEFQDSKVMESVHLKARDGSQYRGRMENWRPHGQGELRLANGDVYRGSFEYGIYNGEGTLTYAKPQPDGRTQDTGTWAYGRHKKTEEDENRRTRANIELALYGQDSRLSRVLSEMAPRDPRSINLYVLTVAGQGSEEVFRREADFVRAQFDARFGTQGHSLALVNSRNTAGTSALATVTSIRRSISALAGAMDKERDILFLYITSHGDKNKELSLGLPGMDFPGLGASELGTLLKESGIRWKVVVISSCYAGGFLDDLRDANTLVIAASRADRRSFGCADENEFTYFGRAFFKEALPQLSSFEDAFAKASQLITEWEERDAQKLQAADSDKTSTATDRHSLPQMEAPKAISDYLRLWWAQFPTVRSQIASHPDVAPNRRPHSAQ